MRSLLLLFAGVASFLTMRAQTGTEALFQKGTELEYRTLAPKMGFGKTKMTETTRLTLVVQDVKDSAGVIYSYVIKKAAAAADPGVGYQKTYVLTRTAGTVSLPADLYIADTVYRVDMGMGSGKKGARPYATAAFKGNPRIELSGSVDKGKMEYNPKTYTVGGMMMGANMDMTSPMYNSPSENGWSMEVTATDFRVGSKTQLTTPAGTFECYKITSTSEVKALGHKMEVHGTVYYSPKYGMLKTEPGDDSAANGGFELVRVKNPG